MNALELFVLVAVAGGTGWMLWLSFRSNDVVEARLKARALDQFRATRVVFPALGLEFDGGRAEIVKSRETKYLASVLESNYVLTVSARMPDGVEYEFKSDAGGQPWVICRSRADAHAMRGHAAF
jgi:hypothetical protein